MNEMPEQPDMRTAQQDAAAGEEVVPSSPLRPFARLLLAVLLLAGAIAGWRYMMATAPTHAPRPAKEAVEPVRVTTVELRDVRPVWTLYGQVVPARSAQLRFPLSGRVAWKAEGLKEGAPVEAGQVLARLEDLPQRAAVREAEATLDEARARLDEMRAQLELEEIAERNAREQLDIALRDLRRARTLNRRGTLSDAALDERRLAASQKRLAHAQRVSNVKALKARIAQQEATLKRLEWALKRARKNLGDTVLTAPFSGTASAVAFETGQQVGPADRLLTVVSSEPPEIRFALSERQYGALRSAGEKLEGRKVRVIWRTASGPLEIAATVRRVAPEVAAGKGVVHLYAVPDDPRKARWLKSGTFVEVKLPGPLERDAALLPEQAVYDGARVYAVVEGRLRALPVRLVGHAGDRAVVAGLGGGEKVVVNRMADPVEGRKAKVLP